MKAFNLFLLFTIVSLVTACGDVGQKFSSATEQANESVTDPAQSYGELANGTLNIPTNAVADVPVTITVEGKGYPISPNSSPEALRFIDGLLASVTDPTQTHRLPISLIYVLTREECVGLCLPGTIEFKVLVLNIGLPID